VRNFDMRVSFAGSYVAMQKGEGAAIAAITIS
jgi:hypothetical protein